MAPETKNIRITGFGIACIDYITVAPDVDSAGFSEIISYRICGGGITGTSCVAAARLGADVSYISRLGDDAVGDQIIDSLVCEGVDVAGVVRIPGGKSLFSWIRVDPQTGERFIFSRRDQDIDCGVDVIDLDVVCSADVVLLDDHWPEGARYVAGFAGSKNIPVICDVRLKPQNHDLMPLVDFAIISSGYAASVSRDGTKEGALEGILNLGASNAVVTCGEEGAWYSSGKEHGFVPAFQIDAVDTTGAGDVFHGAFAYGVGKGYDIRQCTVFASAVAALKCTGLGGREAIPTFQQTMDFLHRQHIEL